ncbi:hypothetical protein [Massilia sp. Se16.2.3]|uniref:hypothetical protein n=1 Tax=Massilia sp. Se16.2.3 TaxID=2709303 RepID=UPI001E570F1D|nr:hypothetical protein [Massilia sp. Se16.2.3]
MRLRVGDGRDQGGRIHAERGGLLACPVPGRREVARPGDGTLDDAGGRGSGSTHSEDQGKAGDERGAP